MHRDPGIKLWQLNAGPSVHWEFYNSQCTEGPGEWHMAFYSSLAHRVARIRLLQPDPMGPVPPSQGFGNLLIVGWNWGWVWFLAPTDNW